MRQTVGRHTWTLFALLVSAILACGVLVAFPQTPSHAEGEAPTGCGYGTGGPSADTVCWLQFPDFATVTPEEAEAGQHAHQSVKLGDYTLSFDTDVTSGAQGANGVMTVPMPTWDGSVMGNSVGGASYYTGLSPQKYAFYQSVSSDLIADQYNERDTITLSNITMTGPGGATLDAGWSMIISDAETTSNYEGFVWKSDKVMSKFLDVVPSGYSPICAGDPNVLAGGVTGLGSTTVECRGGSFAAGSNPNRGILAVQSDAPSKISSTFINATSSSRQGVAFGVMFSKVAVNKVVDSRYQASDQFSVAMTDSLGNQIDSASTSGTGTSAKTAQHPIITSTEGSDVTFSETGLGSTDLDHYTAEWVCTDNGTTIPANKLTLGANGRTVTTRVDLGSFVDCTVTNTARLGTVTWAKTDGTNALAGSEWELTGPDGFSEAIVDNGDNDEDDADGALKVSSLAWGDYTLTETKAPTGHNIDPTSTKTFTIDADSTEEQLGDIVNTPVPGTLTWAKTDGTNLLGGSEWELGREGADPVLVVDNGAKDEDPAVGALKVSGLAWGDYTLTETKAPAGYAIGDPADHDVTLGADATAVDLGPIVNTQILGEVTWAKTDGTNALAGSEWELTGPDGFSEAIVDNGDNDEDDADGALKVSGLAWGDYTLTETKAPTGHIIDPTSTKTFTIDADSTDKELGEVVNTLGAPALEVKKSADPASGSLVKPGQTITYAVTAENTGNVPLTPATITDDLSDVLDDASYVEGSAKVVTDAGDPTDPKVSGNTLNWSGALDPGQKATITYQVKVHDDLTAGDVLKNVVTGSADVPPGFTPPVTNCVPETAAQDPDCSTHHTPVVPPTPTPTPTPTTPPTPTPSPSPTSGPSTSPATPSSSQPAVPVSPTTSSAGPGASVHTGGDSASILPWAAGAALLLLGVAGLAVGAVRRYRLGR